MNGLLSKRRPLGGGVASNIHHQNTNSISNSGSGSGSHNNNTNGHRVGVVSPLLNGGNSGGGWSTSSSYKRLDLAMILTRGLILVLALYVLVVVVVHVQSFSSQAQATNSKSTPNSSSNNINIKSKIEPYARKQQQQKDYCDFRKYPPRRYYGLPTAKESLPDFLQQSEYIFGQLPVLLQPKAAQSMTDDTQKLCVDQSEWYPAATADDDDDDRLPFADGTNPSILKLANNPRIQPAVRALFPPNAAYLTTICMTNSQCAWRDTPQERIDYKLSTLEEPATVRTVLLVLDEHFETLVEATIRTVMDAPFGKRKRPHYQKDKDGNVNKSAFEEGTHSLDDARLFTYQGNIWVSYREGKLFGYDKQVLNPVHVSFANGGNGNKNFQVRLKASDTETLCCGRNMALMDNVRTNHLQALTWVDPVTVVDVEMTQQRHQQPSTSSQSAMQQQPQDHRRLAEQNGGKNNNNKKKKKKSHFHGTNGFMVHLAKTNEYLGIGHFHRPPGRDANEYARFGHHYTHAFFTITDGPPFRLKRLSPELVLPSHAHKDDAEIIQFWSGLEIGLDESTLTLAYGINDCEGAATTLDLATVDGLLRDVEEGKEVVDCMMPLQ